MFWKSVTRILSPAGGRAKLLVFIFHRVLQQRDPLLEGEPDVSDFDWMLRVIGNAFNVLTFGEAMSLVERNALPPAAACITFDDGYRDNATLALPLLKRHGLTATFFVASSFLNGGRMWNDDVIEAIRLLPAGVQDWTSFGLGRHETLTITQRRDCIDMLLRNLKYRPHQERCEVARELARQSGVPDTSELMMNSEELRLLRRDGMEIGGHTHSHPILSGLSDQEAESEIERGKIELESILGESIETFAYPNGNTSRDLGARHAEMVKHAGFRAAVTTDCGIATRADDPFLIPRFTPWDRTPRRFALRCAMMLALNKHSRPAGY